MDNGHTFKEIANAARRLHWNYGRGNVEWVHVFGDGRIELCAKPTSCKPIVFNGHLVGKASVRLHGHQCKIGFEQTY